MEDLIHLIVGLLLPSMVYLHRVLRLFDAIEATEANSAIGLQLIQGLTIFVLVCLASLPLFLLVFLRHADLHLVLAVGAESLQILTVLAHSFRMLGVSQTHFGVSQCILLVK